MVSSKGDDCAQNLKGNLDIILMRLEGLRIKILMKCRKSRTHERNPLFSHNYSRPRPILLSRHHISMHHTHTPLDKRGSKPNSSSNHHTSCRHYCNRSTCIRGHRRHAPGRSRRSTTSSTRHRRRAGTRTRRRNRQRRHCLQQLRRSRIRHHVSEERERRAGKREARYGRGAGESGALGGRSLGL